MFNREFKALSDPTRRKILQFLSANDLTAGEIAAHFNSSWPTISHHLEVLKSAGLVTAERNGQHIKYSANLSVMHEIAAWFTEFVDKPKGKKTREKKT
ncbi:MAG: winged helix-turn-helix transcriptional regulator [Anaerolineales bacterium]|nr:winged helix-turn-helix transcriptional regulator [Anaerolineales bacterium]